MRAKSKQATFIYVPVNIDRIQINSWNPNMYHDSIVWVYQILKILKISLKLDCGLLDWWLVVQRVWCYRGCCVFLFPGSVFFIANCDFCHCHIHIHARPRMEIYIMNIILHVDLRKNHPKVSHHKPPTFIITVRHSCHPMSQPCSGSWLPPGTSCKGPSWRDDGRPWISLGLIAVNDWVSLGIQ